MEEFVCARLVRAENLDLSLFRFDPDQSFCVFFLDAEGTLYGRFGSRSDYIEAEREISFEGLEEAMEKALEWHAMGADEKTKWFAAKRGDPPKYRTLLDYPAARGRAPRGGGPEGRGFPPGRGEFEGRGEREGREGRGEREGREEREERGERGERGEREGRGEGREGFEGRAPPRGGFEGGGPGGPQGARCTHCHDLRAAEQRTYLQSGEPMPEESLFSWPMPDVVGLHMDPSHSAIVQEVAENSAAAQAGFLAGDEILSFEQQPILSTADVQWVLQTAPATGAVTAAVEREGKRLELTLPLTEGWRHAANVGWRTTTRMLRSTLTGGVEFRALDAEERAEYQLGADVLALTAENNPGRNARSELRNGDVLVSVDGSEAPLSEMEFLLHLAQHPGQEVKGVVLRDDARREITLQSAR